MDELEIDAECVSSAKKSSTLQTELTFIEANFKKIPEIIDQLQSNKIALVTAVEKMEEISCAHYPGHRKKNQ